MTSKNSLFNLIKEDFKRRIWSVGLSVLIQFFIFIVVAIFMRNYYNANAPFYSPGTAENVKKTLDMFEAEFTGMLSSYFGGNNNYITFFIMFLSLVTAISGFSFLLNKNRTDFYHCLPVKREKLFLIICLNSILIVGIPYLFFILSMPLIFIGCLDTLLIIKITFTGFIVNMCTMFMFHMVTVLAVMLTGKILLSILGSFILYFASYCADSLITFYKNAYFSTYYAIPSFNILKYISPSTIGFAYNSPYSVRLCMIMFLAVLCFVSAFILYKIRPSEAAGNAIAFKYAKAPIKFIIAFESANIFSLIFAAITDSNGWIFFGLISGTVISCLILEIIYNADFKKLFSNIHELIIISLFSVLFLSFYRFDLSGYDRYMPGRDSLESAGIVINVKDSLKSHYMESFENLKQYYDNDSFSYDVDYKQELYSINDKPVYKDYILNAINNMKYTDFDNIYSIIQKGIELNKKKDSPFSISMDSQQLDYVPAEIIVAYHLKNKKTVYRKYTVNYYDIADEYIKLISDDEYKKSVYPVFSMESSKLSSITYGEIDDMYLELKFSDNSEDIKNELLEAYRTDFLELDSSTYTEKPSLGYIQFRTDTVDKKKSEKEQDKQDSEDSDYYVNDIYGIGFYPVYTSFTNTISVLKKMGVEVGSSLDVKNIDSAIIVSPDHEADEHKELIFAFDYGMKVDFDQIIDQVPYSVMRKNAVKINLDDTTYNLKFYTDKNDIEDILASGFSPHYFGDEYIRKYDRTKIAALLFNKVPESWENVFSSKYLLETSIIFNHKRYNSFKQFKSDFEYKFYYDYTIDEPESMYDDIDIVEINDNIPASKNNKYFYKLYFPPGKM